MTPCEEKGLKVGGEFEVLRNSAFFRKGEIVILHHDDGTSNPYFYNQEIADSHDGDLYWPVSISNVRAINQGE